MDSFFDKIIEQTEHKLNPRGTKMHMDLPADALEGLKSIRVLPAAPPKEALKKNSVEVVDMSKYRNNKSKPTNGLF